MSALEIADSLDLIKASAAHESLVSTRRALVVPLRTWIAVAGSTLGAFMAVLNIQITNPDHQPRSPTPRWPTSRVRSAPASTTAAGSPPPTWSPRSWSSR